MTEFDRYRRQIHADIIKTAAASDAVESIQPTKPTEPEDLPPKLRILWTTTGMCQPIVSLAVIGDIDASDLLTGIGEHIIAGRKRQGDKVEIVVGRNCEDHVTVTANATHFAKPKPDNTIAPPALVRWLVRELPVSGLLGPKLEIEVAWMPHGTREIHVQPRRA